MTTFGVLEGKHHCDDKSKNIIEIHCWKNVTDRELDNVNKDTVYLKNLQNQRTMKIQQKEPKKKK